MTDIETFFREGVIAVVEPAQPIELARSEAAKPADGCGFRYQGIWSNAARERTGARRTGAVNPSGKLPISFPRTEDDLPSSRSSVGEPPQRLVAWQKVELQPHETRHLTVPVDERQLMIWTGAWHVEPGDYELRVGSSSRDIRLHAPVRI